MAIDVKRIAALAKLQLEEDKVEMFATQMQSIVDMCANLPPMEHRLSALNENDAMQLRADVVEPSLTRDEMLQNAPKKNAGCIEVPKTV